MERALAYAALSYGFGFLVVMLHTARLGFPVLGLLEPVYVWIGSPLAAVAFFGNQLNNFVSQSAAEARDSFIAIVGDFRNANATVAEPTRDYVEHLATYFAGEFPLVPLFPGLNARVYKPVLRWALTKRTGDASGSQPVTTFESNLALLGSRLLKVSRFFSAAALVTMLGLALLAYVWLLYPRIPKAYGGGAPVTVKMVLSRSAVPPTLLSELGVQSLAVQEQGAQTGDLTLLYSTSDAYYVRTLSGGAVSLSAAAVNAIIWPPSSSTITSQPDSGVTLIGELSVHFEANRTFISRDTEQTLRDVVSRVKSTAGMCLRLAGHADRDGSSEYNLRLSNLRVEAVRSFAEREGLQRNRIITVAHGETAPQAVGESESAKAQNRRVVVSVSRCDS